MAKKKDATKEAKKPVAATNDKKKSGFSGKQIGGILGALFLAAVMFTGSSTNPLTYVAVTDEDALRKVFFSGDVWAVACHSVNSTQPLSENFEAAAVRLQEEMKFAVLDCKAALPGSGRTTMQRWKLKAHMGEPVLFVANGVGVQQIPGTSARSEYDLVRELRLAAWRRPLPIKNTEQLREKCLYKPRCVLVMKGGTELEPGMEKALHHLAGKHASGASEADSGVTFTSLDSQDLRLSFEGYEAGESVKLRRFEALSHRVIYFRNSSGVTYALAHKGPLSEASVGGFLDGVAHDEAGEPNKRLAMLSDEVTLGRRPLPKAKKPKAQPKKKEAPIPKAGEQLTPEAREKLVKERQARERGRRDEMEREASESGHFAQASEEEEEEEEEEDGDHYADDDDEDVMELD